MRIARYFIGILIAVIISICFAVVPKTTAPTATPPFKAERDYLSLPSSSSQLTNPSNKVTVVEFFSYGCPWCFRLEPDLENWLKTLPQYVVFQRVPVEFESGWDVYARSYYVASDLNVLPKIQLALFQAIQQQNMDLTTENAMANFFNAHGISQDDFRSAFESSPDIDVQVKNGRKLISDYLIYQTPTLVIDGKYKVDPSLTGGDNKKLLAVVNYLIALQAKQKSIQS